MGNREEKRNLETIPVGSLGIISLPGCKSLGEKVDQFLVKWRAERESEHKDSLAFSGYQRESYLLNAKVPRFGSGEAKGMILESTRGTDLYLLVDVLNHSLTYSLCGHENHMSPDDHYQDLKRIIAAVTSFITFKLCHNNLTSHYSLRGSIYLTAPSSSLKRP